MTSWFVRIIPDLELELNQDIGADNFLQTTFDDFLTESSAYNNKQSLITQQAVFNVSNELRLIRALPLSHHSTTPLLLPMLLPAEHNEVTIALKNVLQISIDKNLSAQKRSMVAMVQASGSGKTKLAHTLATEPSGPIVVFSVAQINQANGELIAGTPWRLAQDLLEQVRDSRVRLSSNDPDYHNAFILAAKVGKWIIEMTILAHFDATLEFLSRFKNQPTARRDLVLRLNNGGVRLVTYFLRRRMRDFLNRARTANSVNEMRSPQSFSDQLRQLASDLKSLADPDAEIPILFVLDEMPILHKRVRRLFFHVKSGLQINDAEIFEQQRENDLAELKPDMLYITQLVFADMVQLSIPVLGIGTDHVLLETLSNDSVKFSPNQFCPVRPFRELCPFSVDDLVRIFSSYFQTNLSQDQLQELLRPLQGRPLFFTDFLSTFVSCISQLNTKSVEDLIKKSVDTAVQINITIIRNRLKNGSLTTRYDDFHDVDVQATFAVAIQGGIMRHLNDFRRNTTVAAGLAMLAQPTVNTLDLRQEPIVHEALWLWGIEESTQDDPVITHIQRMLSPEDFGHDGDVFELALLRAFQRSWWTANDKSLLNILLPFINIDTQNILNNDVKSFLASISCAPIGPACVVTEETPMASNMLPQLNTGAVLFRPPSSETGPDVVLLPCPGVAVVIQCKSGGSTLLESLGTLSPGLFGTTSTYKQDTLLNRLPSTERGRATASLERVGITIKPPPSRLRDDWALLGINTVIRAITHPSPFSDAVKTHVMEHNRTDFNTPILLLNLPQPLVGSQLSALVPKSTITLGQGVSGPLPLTALRLIKDF